MKFMKKTLLSLTIFFVYSTYGQSPVHIEQIKYHSTAAVTTVPILIKKNEMVPVSQNQTKVLQYGNKNSLDVKITAKTHDLTYAQLGDKNNIDVDVQGYDVQQNVIQAGDNNTFSQYTNNPFVNQNMEVHQNGTNLDVTVFGENSMSKDMRIYMEGSDRNIIINNFN